MTEDPKELERYLHEHIPLSAHLGVRVAEAGEAGVRLAAPLAPNLNHQQTAFGGSLSAVAILSAWSLLHLRVGDIAAGHGIVIQTSTFEYLAPAAGDFEAWCPAPEPRAWERFARALRQRGRGRILLAAEVTCAAERVGEFRGRYVALSPEDA